MLTNENSAFSNPAVWTSASPSLYPTTAAHLVDRSPIKDEVFNPLEALCPKCLLGNLDPDKGVCLTLQFLAEKDVEVDGELIFFPELLRVTCNRCFYAWRMHPADCDCWEEE